MQGNNSDRETRTTLTMLNYASILKQCLYYVKINSGTMIKVLDLLILIKVGYLLKQKWQNQNIYLVLLV